MSKKIDQIDIIQSDEITDLSEQPVFFIRRCGDYATSSDSAWVAMRQFIKQANLNPSELRYFSIAHDNPEITDATQLRFDACIASHADIRPVGELSQQILPSGRFAIFTHSGSHDTLSETFDRIFFKWLPSNALQHDTHRIIFCEHLQTTIKIFIPLS